MKRRDALKILAILVVFSLFIYGFGSNEGASQNFSNIIKELFIQKEQDILGKEELSKEYLESLSPEKEINEFPTEEPLTALCTMDPIPGKIYLKFKKGNDVSSKQKASDLIQQIKDSDISLTNVQNTKQKFPLKTKDNRKKEIREKIGLGQWIELDIDHSLDVKIESKKWLNDSRVEEVDIEREPCLLLHPEEESRWQFNAQWYHENIGYGQLGVNTTPDADMDTVEAWNITTGAGITVAAPDTSVFWHHEDIIDNIWQNLGEDADGDGKVIQPGPNETIFYEYTYPNGTTETRNRTYLRYIFDPDDINGIDDDDWDGDPTTYIDDFIGWDMLSNDNDTMPEPTDSSTYRWHGTWTASSVAATGNNSIGLTGMCWNCKIITFRRAVGNSNAIYYSVENGAKVISMSWMNYYTGTMRDALDYAHEMGVVLFAGAGNFGQTNNWFNGLCDSEKVLCVTGTTPYDTAWMETSYGPGSDVGAPSATMLEATPYDHPLNIYTYNSGTSIGSPTTAGLGALILSKNPNLEPYEVISIIQSSTDPIINPPTGKFIGTGRINAHKALQLTNKTLFTNNHFPKALLNVKNSTQVADKYQLMGIANSTNLSNVQIWRSSGDPYPTNWQLITNITNPSPVEDNIIYEVDLSSIPSGQGQFKLVVIDEYNQTAYDTFTFENTYSCIEGENSSCGTSTCTGIKTCTSGTWGDCSTFGADGGICTLCDQEGNLIYDPTQNIDCNDTFDCTTDLCIGIGSCYNDYFSCECEFNENCTSSIIQGQEFCQNNQLIHNVTTTNYTCNAGYCTPDTESTIRELVEDCALNGEICGEEGCSEIEVNDTNQTIILNMGWNIISLRLNNNSYKSSNLNSLFVMKYSYGSWELDIHGNAPFILEPLRGYYVYSTQNKTINISGYKLNNTQKYNTLNNTWNLFTVNNTQSYEILYPEGSLNTSNLYETNGSSHTEILNFSIPLDPTKYYWANLGNPELSPPRKMLF